MRLPDVIDINPLRPIVNFFKDDIEILPNELGGSDASSALRQLIGTKRREVKGIIKKREMNPKQLVGKMFHYFWQIPECRDALLNLIYKQTGIKIKKSEVRTEAYKRLCLYCRYEDVHLDKNGNKIRERLEECPNCGNNRWTRHHVDEHTDKYLIEFKTSFMYVTSFEKRIKEEYYNQINFYMGSFEAKEAIVIYFNLQCLNNTFHSWDEIFNKYGYVLPMEFDQDNYMETIDKFLYVFKHRDDGIDINTLPCPHSNAWECKPKNCELRDQCNNPIEYLEIGPDEPYCSHCRHKIKQNPKTKKKTVPAFRRNGKIYCKDSSCEQACIDDWEVVD